MVSVYWGPRREDRAQCAMRVKAHFAALSSASANLGRWYHRGRERPSVDRPVDVSSSEALITLIEAGANRRDDNRNIIPELGFHVGFWNGAAGGWSASTDITCGLYAKTKGLSNVALLSVDFDAKSALSASEMARLLKRLIESWDPDTGKVWQSYWWPNATGENAELRERVYVSYRTSGDTPYICQPTILGEPFGRGRLWYDSTQEHFFKQVDIDAQ